MSPDDTGTDPLIADTDGDTYADGERSESRRSDPNDPAIRSPMARLFRVCPLPGIYSRCSPSPSVRPPNVDGPERPEAVKAAAVAPDRARCDRPAVALDVRHAAARHHAPTDRQLPERNVAELGGGPATPTNVPDGGPRVTGDRYPPDHARSNGNLGTSNLAQWTGNYTAAQVTR